jgi:hypothetical protein
MLMGEKKGEQQAPRAPYLRVAQSSFFSPSSSSAYCIADDDGDAHTTDTIEALERLQRQT